MPAAPDDLRVEHVAAPAHVAERRLAAAVRAAAGDARDPGDGAARAPRLGARHVPGVRVHAVRLARVLVHVAVDRVDHVRTDRSAEDRRQAQGLARLLSRARV